MPARSRARRIPRVLPTCAHTRRNTPRHSRDSRRKLRRSRPALLCRAEGRGATFKSNLVGGKMEQGSSASALAARTAGMTDEQILDLDLEALQAGGGVLTQRAPASSAGAPGDFSDEWEAALSQ